MFYRLYALIVISVASFSVNSSQTLLNDGNLVLKNIPDISNVNSSEIQSSFYLRTAKFLDWNNSGGMIISTKFGQTVQLHEVKKPGGARKQITFFEERVRNAYIQPGGNLLAFTSDIGGNETNQIYVLDNKTGSHQLITDGKFSYGTPVWSHDGKYLAYHRRIGKAAEVWIAEHQHDSVFNHKKIFSIKNAMLRPRVFDESSKFLTISHFHNSSSRSIYMADLRSQQVNLIKSGENSTYNIPMFFSSNSKGLYYLSNRYGSYKQMVYLDLKTGTDEVVTQSINNDIFLYSKFPKSHKSVFAVNVKGSTTYYYLNLKSNRYKRIKSMPIGVGSSLEFDRSGRYFATTISAYNTPGDVFTYDLKKKKVKRWTNSETGSLNADNFIKPQYFEYPTFDTENDGAKRVIPSFIYKPASKAPLPVIISIHGGPSSQSTSSFNFMHQLWMKTLGVALITPNVRGSTGYGKDFTELDNIYNRENSVKDIGALLDWIETQEDLDASRVAVYGASYGGYMSLATAIKYNTRIKAVIDNVGITDFVTFLENTSEYRRILRRDEYGDERVPEVREYLNSISPLHNFEKIKAPLFIVQGENDSRVPSSQAKMMFEKLNENGQEVWFMNALNEGHGYNRRENKIAYYKACLMFLRRHLLNPSEE